MPLSWNEIKSRAAAFVKEWEHETSEDAEAKTFWDEFFNVFDIKRRRLASFEYHVKKLDNRDGFIDLFWPGTMIVEHKSKGKSLDKAHGQVLDYFHGIPDRQLPQYILVSDFAGFRLYDIDNNTQKDFPLSKLVDNIQLFGFIAGYQKRTYKEQDAVNIEAAELMGQLHDKLKAIGYNGHALELYLVRLLFCLFADDTSIFEKDIFNEYIELKTAEDGSDLARAVAELFQVLNTPGDKRLNNLDESLAAFPYVNGKLFEEHLPFASFDSEMRKILLGCCGLNWGRISPAIFGSLFQSVMDSTARRNLGAHYTSEKNILKLIRPLFLDELLAEFDKAKNNKAQLQKLHDKISSLRLLDPACGCGNFLLIAYRELRLLEIEIIKRLLKLQGYRDEVIREAKMYADYLIKCNVDQFYGIEYEEFPAQIARTAMWLMDHQMNMLVTETFGEYYVRLPLQKAATIVHGNALRIDWKDLLKQAPIEAETENATITLSEPVAEYEVKIKARNLTIIDERKDVRKKIEIATGFDYILGNPPFIGKQYQNPRQKADLEIVFKGVTSSGVLDYVTAWYFKAAQLIQNTKIKVAFVSTNSISQGEQVGILWNVLYNLYKIKIHFAHRTFSWSNEAKGKAAVHVVIIGFANYDSERKIIYEYDNIKGEPQETFVKNINPYLVGGADTFISKRRAPICSVPEMVFGNMPNDGGHFLFTEEEKNHFLETEPESVKYFRKFIGSEEFINGTFRWCLWLKDASPADLKRLPEISKRIELVKQARLTSKRPATQKLAAYPALFGEIRQPATNYLVFPEVSSERREYIPVGFMSKDVITSNKNYTVANPSFYLFGVLCSKMHMAWVHYVAGRMKSDFSYSTGMVYNNFPWPENPTDKQKEAVEKAAQAVLDARAMFPDSSLADLYDPNTMPPALVKAHQQLDKAVDVCYRSQPFANETKRIEYLFELYDKYTAGLFVKEKKKRIKN